MLNRETVKSSIGGSIPLAEELNAWLGHESCKPVHAGRETTELTAELKRGRSYLKAATEEQKAAAKHEKIISPQRETLRVVTQQNRPSDPQKSPLREIAQQIPLGA